MLGDPSSSSRSLTADDPVRRAHAITLKEHTGSRRLVIFVGSPEGNAMVSTLESVEFPWPMTYQLCVSSIEATGATLKKFGSPSLPTSPMSPS